METAVGRVVVCYLLAYLVKVDGVQYDIYKEALTWENAREACQQHQQRLAHVVEELHHVRIRNYRYFVHNDFWIGLRKEAASTYRWTDGSAALFTAWESGEPVDQCTFYNATTFQWQTRKCSDTLYFMCETLGLPEAKVSGQRTVVSGVLIGLASILGLLILGLLLVHMPGLGGSAVRSAFTDWAY